MTIFRFFHDGLSAPKGDSKREFLRLALRFISSLQVIVETSNLVCELNIANPSLPMTNSDVTSLTFGKSAIISRKRYKIAS